GGPPAFATRMSTRPKWLLELDTSWPTSLSLVTSPGIARTSAPVAARISSAHAVSRSLSRALITRDAPSDASSSAVALPRPVDAAATMASRPLRPRFMREALFHQRLADKCPCLQSSPRGSARTHPSRRCLRELLHCEAQTKGSPKSHPLGQPLRDRQPET